MWTRLDIVASTADLPVGAAKRLLQNQVDIGDAIKPYYGDAAGAQLTALLKDHIVISMEIIDAATKGDTARKESASKRWYANADEIATFLSGANPKHWPLGEMKKMMREHLEIDHRRVGGTSSKDWAADVKAYDKVQDLILQMAEAARASARSFRRTSNRGGRPRPGVVARFKAA